MTRLRTYTLYFQIDGPDGADPADLGAAIIEAVKSAPSGLLATTTRLSVMTSAKRALMDDDFLETFQPRLKEDVVKTLRAEAEASEACGDRRTAAALTLLLDWYETSRAAYQQNLIDQGEP